MKKIKTKLKESWQWVKAQAKSCWDCVCSYW